MTVSTHPQEAKERSVLYTLLEKWYLWAPLLLCAVIMLPRLVSAEFGLFDDGVTIASAQQLSGGQSYIDMDAASGRFRPAYWLYYGALYLIFGANPLAYFTGNSLIWLATTAGMIWLVRRAGGNQLQAGSAGILFVLSGPVFENYYTLSKSEPLQLFWLVLALFCTSFFQNQKTHLGRGILTLVATILVWLALASKETSIVLLPISFSWLILAWIWKRQNRDINLSPYLLLFSASLLASAAYWLWRSSFISGIVASDGYSGMYSLDLSLLISSAKEWLGWLRRDFTYFGFLLLFAVVSAAANRRLSKVSLIYVLSLMWIAGWFLIFLPWIYKLEYYLLAVAAGCAFFGGFAFGEMVRGLGNSRAFTRIGTAVLLILAGTIWLVNLPEYFYNARLQLTMDSVNAELLDYLSQNVPPNGNVHVNLPADNEYVLEIGLHLRHIYNRPDITVDRFFFQRPAVNTPIINSVVVSPIIENRPSLSVRHAFQSDDAARYLESIQQYLGRHAEPVFVHQKEYTWKSFHLFRLACLFLPNYPSCISDGQLLTSLPLRYGWSAYSYHLDNNQIAHPGFFKDGIWSLDLSNGSMLTLQFGQAGDIPIVGDWNGDERSDIGVYRPNDRTWYLDIGLDGQVDRTLTWADMQPGDIPLTGDWTGSGFDSPGFFRPSGSSWYIRTGFDNQAGGNMVLKSGSTTDIPLSGDWNGDGMDTFGVYRPDTGEINLENQLDANLDGTDFLLPPGIHILTAEWGVTGEIAPADALAYIQGDQIMLHPVNCACTLSNLPKPIQFKPEWGSPLAGNWKNGLK